MEEIKNWTLVVSSLDNSSELGDSLVTEDSQEHNLGNVVVEIFPEYCDISDESETSLAQEDFDVAGYLGQLISDILHLEKRKRKLIDVALDFNFEKAMHTLVTEALARKLRMASTVRELEQIIDGDSILEDEIENQSLVVPPSRNTRQDNSGVVQNHLTCLKCNESSCLQIIAANPILLDRQQQTEIIEEVSVDEILAENLLFVMEQQIRSLPTSQEKNKIGSPAAIMVVFRLLQLYIKNDNIANDCGRILDTLAAASQDGGRNIVTLKNGLEILCQSYHLAWPRRDVSALNFIIGVPGVFFHTSHHNALIIFIQRDDCLEALLKTFKFPGFYNYDVLSCVALVNIFRFIGNDWKFKLSKKEVQEIMLKGFSEWQVGLIAPIGFKSMYSFLRDVRHSYLPIQYFSAWVLANETTMNPENNCAAIRKQGAVKILEGVLASEECNPGVARLVQTTLDNLKMNEGLNEMEAVE